MNKFFGLIAAIVSIGSADAGTLVLKISNIWTRDCGKITQVTNSNADAVTVRSATCTCDLSRSLSIADSMELLRSNERLTFTCEAENLNIGDQFNIQNGISASMATRFYSVQVVAQ